MVFAFCNQPRMMVAHRLDAWSCVIENLSNALHRIQGTNSSCLALFRMAIFRRNANNARF